MILSKKYNKINVDHSTRKEGQDLVTTRTSLSPGENATLSFAEESSSSDEDDDDDNDGGQSS